ncbi:MAG: hypothetical protein QHH17_03310 [Candidatus Bathyarchaeota archaeon]|jgi:hypothetical protein|nr:hypothetical protein [Candidatus Bathyarchaeota archaeon]
MTTQVRSKRDLRSICESISRRVDEILEAWLYRFRDNVFVAWLIAKNTLTVVVMALIILTPIIVYPFLMMLPEPQCYIAYIIWIALFVGSCILSAMIGYLRETQREKPVSTIK